MLAATCACLASLFAPHQKHKGRLWGAEEGQGQEPQRTWKEKQLPEQTSVEDEDLPLNGAIGGRCEAPGPPEELAHRTPGRAF